MRAADQTKSTHEPTIGADPDPLDSRKATCIGEGIKAGAAEMIPFNDEIKATADAIADGSLKPFKDAVSTGTAVEAAHQGAEHVAENRSVQKAIKSALRSQGVKTSANAVGRASSLLSKAFTAVSAAFAINAAYGEYQACMAH
jgi:hypothetical protein